MTPMLALDLNRGMTAGTDHVDDNAHQNVTGKSHGTNQGLMRIIGRDCGNVMGKRQTHPGTTSPRNQQKNSQRFQADWAKTETTQEQKTPPYFDSKELMEIMIKEFF